jgi:hypothetical protein
MPSPPIFNATSALSTASCLLSDIVNASFLFLYHHHWA